MDRSDGPLEESRLSFRDDGNHKVELFECPECFSLLREGRRGDHVRWHDMVDGIRAMTTQELQNRHRRIAAQREVQTSG